MLRMLSFLKPVLPVNLYNYFKSHEGGNIYNYINNSSGITTSYLFSSEPDKNLIVSVIVPVKDEELYIIKTLDALRNQVDNREEPLNYTMYEVLLLINNSTDASYKIAKAYQQKHQCFQLHIANITLPKKVAHIGTVRRLLMDEACRRLQSVNNNGIIASTDGDTEVDSMWLHHTIKEINKGNDVVGGRIISKPVNEKIRRYYLQDVTYRYLAKKLETKINPCTHDPWPSHFQCYGASMAVQCAAYKKAGGLPAVPFLEDAAFCSASYRIDSKIRCSPEVKVYTSARRSNRVNVGFSAHLKHLENMRKEDEQQYVESPEILKIKFLNKQRLKHYWDNRNTTVITKTTLHTITKTLNISTRWLLRRFNTAAYFGELWEDTEARIYKSRKWRKMNKYILITDAIQQLRACINQ